MITKRCFFALVILTMVVIMSGCNANERITPTIEDFSKIEFGTQQEEILRKFGEPSGTLSGFWGDIYTLEDKTRIIVYYDTNGQVERITATDMEGSQEIIIE